MIRDDYLTIGQLAERSGVATSALRFYGACCKKFLVTQYIHMILKDG